MAPETQKIPNKNLGHANGWAAIPKELEECRIKGHNHIQIRLDGTRHQIQCQECHFEFTEEGEAPLLKRVLPPAPPAEAEKATVDPTIIASLVSLLDDMTKRMERIEKRMDEKAEGKR